MKILYAPCGGQNGSATVYALLKHMYHAKFGGEPIPEIQKTPNGKPYFPDRPDVYFSLSHSRTHVLCALSDKPVGVDIESPRTISERAVIYFCSNEELALFDPLDLWVLKESYVKLFGETMAMIKSLRFSRDGDRIVAPDKSVISKLYRSGDYRAAVCSIYEAPPDSIEPAPIDFQ